jgi:hypothetical protein
MKRAVLWAVMVGLLCRWAGADEAKAPAAENLIIVTIDGMRWQEVFGGFDPLLATKEAGGLTDQSLPRIQREYARPSAEESRAAILPFFWEVVAKKGQVFGDRGVKNVGRVTNPYRFSYPGYNEMLCGFVDPKINTNDYPPNPNVTVLEWLNTRPGFEGRVAAYGGWERLKEIINAKRSGIPCVCGWDPIEPFHGLALTEREKFINELLARTTRHWIDEPPDSFTMEAAMEHFVRHKPRVFYVMLGETDDWAHGRRYDLYLESARRSDEFIRRLWETAQGMPQYAGKTALLIATDHGRGHTPLDWTGHGAKIAGADGWWAAVMGPNVEPKGAIGEGEETEGQTAATIAGLLGEDWNAVEKRAAAALPGVVIREAGAPAGR